MHANNHGDICRSVCTIYLYLTTSEVLDLKVDFYICENTLKYLYVGTIYVPTDNLYISSRYNTTHVGVVRQHIHEVLADVPSQEVIPDGALEGVPGI